MEAETMTRTREYRPPRIPDGWSWIIGVVIGLVLFLVTYLTGFLEAIPAGIVAVLLVLAVGIGINLWDAKAYYYQRAYDQFDLCEDLLGRIADMATEVRNSTAHSLLRSISDKVKRLLDPDEGIINPTDLGDEFLSTATSFGIALTTVADGADKYHSLENSLEFDEDTNKTMADAIEQFKTIDKWLIEADHHLRSADRVGLKAINSQMKSYKFRAL
jgi:hypothetical protein